MIQLYGVDPKRTVIHIHCLYVYLSFFLVVAMIKQFLESVDWGNLDYLIIDTPPGTSDEHMAIVEYLQQKNPTAIIVTTPQVKKLYVNSFFNHLL